MNSYGDDLDSLDSPDDLDDVYCSNLLVNPLSHMYTYNNGTQFVFYSEDINEYLAAVLLLPLDDCLPMKFTHFIDGLSYFFGVPTSNIVQQIKTIQELNYGLLGTIYINHYVYDGKFTVLSKWDLDDINSICSVLRKDIQQAIVRAVKCAVFISYNGCDSEQPIVIAVSRQNFERVRSIIKSTFTEYWCPVVIVQHIGPMKLIWH